MKKQKLIEYFNEIWPYLNLSELCKTYNIANPKDTIDYNNLRNTINGKAPNRLSEEKLIMFYDFVIKEIFQKVFKLASNNVSVLQIENIVQIKTKQMLLEIMEELNHGFSNK